MLIVSLKSRTDVLHQKNSLSCIFNVVNICKVFDVFVFSNQRVDKFDRMRVTEASASNNYTYLLEIPEASSQDAGQYSVCCRWGWTPLTFCPPTQAALNNQVLSVEKILQAL